MTRVPTDRARKRLIRSINMEACFHSFMELASSGVFKSSTVLMDDSIAEILRWNGLVSVMLQEFQVRGLHSLELWLQSSSLFGIQDKGWGEQRRRKQAQ